MSKFKVFILDVDGVMTDGKFYYSNKGKIMKVFGADDNDALSLLSEYLEIQFLTGDKKGFAISKKRIKDDMGYKLSLVSTTKRLEWIKSKFDAKKVIYMGDGIFDHYVMQGVGYSIAPANADENAKKFADHITKRKGAERAVAEACLHLMKNFFKNYNPKKPLSKKIKFSGTWTT